MDEQFAIALLKRESTSKKSLTIVLSHSKAVQKLAVKMAKTIKKAGKKKIDIRFVSTAALLHDIGRFEHPPWKEPIMHGVAGSNILKKSGLSRAYQRVCETHLGAGITKKDILKQNLPLPPKDYLPKTIEEKVICYADRLIDGTKQTSVNNDLKRLRRYGKEPEERLKRLHDEINSLMQT